MYVTFLAADGDNTPLMVTTVYLPCAQRSSQADTAGRDARRLPETCSSHHDLRFPKSQQGRNYIISEPSVEVEQIRGRCRIVDKSRRQIDGQEIVAFVLDVRPNRSSSVPRSASPLPSSRFVPISGAFSKTHMLVAFVACEFDCHRNRIMLHEAKRSSTVYLTFVLSVPV